MQHTEITLTELYVTTAEEDGTFRYYISDFDQLIQCCSWKTFNQKTGQRQNFSQESIISMISSVSRVGHSCRPCHIDVPVARWSSTAHSGPTSSVYIVSHFLDVSRLLNEIPVA